MIVFSMPEGENITVVMVVLLTAMLQLVIALQAKEALVGRAVSHAFRALYLAQFAASLAALLEMAVAVSSVEEGLLLPVWPYGRFLSVLPALAGVFLLTSHTRLPKGMKPHLLGCIVVLMRLPVLDSLPWPASQAAHLLTAAWLLADGALAALFMRRQAQAHITIGALRHVIGSIGQGVAVVSRGGWFVERNRAFDDLCRRMGISRPLDRIADLDAAIIALVDDDSIKLTEVDGGRLMRAGESSFLLRNDRFQHGSAVLRQLTLSDVSEADQAALALERHNERLAEANTHLERSIAAIEQEVEARERTQLSRAAHDEWAQRLAIAGLSLDFLINGSGPMPGGMSAREIAEHLKPRPGEGNQMETLDALLPALTEIYAGLGVDILAEGHAGFTPAQQAVLCAVVREAAANAVRHAYARRIHVILWEEDASACLAITSDCVGNEPRFAEGRGIHDMRQRVRQAGGLIVITKSEQFRIEIRFHALSPANMEGVS